MPVTKRELVVITPRGHPLAKQGAVRPVDLKDYPNITYIEASGTYRLIEQRYLAEMDGTQIVYRAHDEDSIAALVSADFGVSIVANVDSLAHANVEIRPLDHP